MSKFSISLLIMEMISWELIVLISRLLSYHSPAQPYQLPLQAVVIFCIPGLKDKTAHQVRLVHQSDVHIFFLYFLHRNCFIPVIWAAPGMVT